MANIFKEIKDWLDGSRKEQIKSEVESRIQLREYSGKIYYSFDDIPLIEVSDLKDSDPCKAIAKSRQLMKNFYGIK